jgi:hypothetical protein
MERPIGQLLGHVMAHSDLMAAPWRWATRVPFVIVACVAPCLGLDGQGVAVDGKCGVTGKKPSPEGKKPKGEGGTGMRYEREQPAGPGRRRVPNMRESHQMAT